MDHSLTRFRSENGKERGLSYYHNPGSEPLRMKTIGQILDEAAAKCPNQEAVISHYEKKTITFLETKKRAEQLGAGFLDLGLKPGDRIALIGVNTIHWYITALACAKAGLIVVMLNPGYQASELEYALKKVEAKAVISDHKFKTQNYPAMLMTLAKGMASTPHSQPLSCPELPDLSYVIVATEENLPGCYRLQDIMKLAKGMETIRAVQETIQPDDPYCIQFSSGTTGVPKGAVISHFALVNSSYYTGKRAGIHEKISTACLPLPLFHIFGTSVGIILGLNLQITLIFPAPIFLKECVIQTLQTYQTDMVFGTPTMLHDLYKELDILLPKSPELQEACAKVELVGTGGSNIPSDLIKNLSKVFPNGDFIGALGMTEAGATCFLLSRDDKLEDKYNTVGRVMDHLEVKVVDENGRMVPFGTPGEVWYRSFSNLLEYWSDEKVTNEAKTKSGWFKSGDVIVLREDGYASVKGRIKHIIIRGGENIFPVEIENFLHSHPDILEAEVYGVDDTRMGEEVAASIKLKPSSTLTEAKIKEYCKGKISHFKIPKYIRFVDSFPLTATRKVQKFLLKKIHEKELQEQTKK
ncbi:medium-chain acyl-CoA ligase ACSF2, mitochondrial [Halyomorpha halys]|uniref:medium-chain acyl-CoA ligase ACSF2, mitochondrial n=1 Tax=Halyomorpha halys TaxID=286706 RepID=UPI0006D51E89|nr:acyl-CoA synthetase family member 2, mitochondrial-like [Halyomorpha halys]